MKKTITLAALALGLAASASAETLTLDDAVLKDANFDGSTTYYTTATGGDISSDKALTMMFVLDWGKLQSASFNGVRVELVATLYTSTTQSGNGAVGLGVRASSADSDILYANTMWQGSASNSANRTLNYSLADYVEDGKIVLTMTTSSSGSTLYVANSTEEQHANSSSLMQTGNEYKAVRFYDSAVASSIDSFYVFDSVLTDTQIKGLAGDAIAATVPEPTTATLSLLALAGLAARRRRK